MMVFLISKRRTIIAGLKSKPSDLTFQSPHGQLGDRSTKCPAVFKEYSWLFLMIIIPMQKYVKLVSDSLFLHNNNPLTIICESETNFHREKTLSST